MAKNFTQSLINLGDRGFGSYRTAELGLNYGEHCFRIRPLVVVSQEAFLIQSMHELGIKPVFDHREVLYK